MRTDPTESVGGGSVLYHDNSSSCDCVLVFRLDTSMRSAYKLLIYYIRNLHNIGKESSIPRLLAALA
jgi:hypothetical protein